MGLSFQPESNEKLAERFSRALDRIYDAEEISNKLDADRPGLHRENVFDFEDGVRIIISRDRARDKIFLHLSGISQNGKVSGKDMLELMIKRFVNLMRRPFAGMAEASASSGGVVHMVIPMGENGEFIGNDDPADSWKKA